MRAVYEFRSCLLLMVLGMIAMFSNVQDELIAGGVRRHRWRSVSSRAVGVVMRCWCRHVGSVLSCAVSVVTRHALLVSLVAFGVVTRHALLSSRVVVMRCWCRHALLVSSGTVGVVMRCRCCYLSCAVGVVGGVRCSLVTSYWCLYALSVSLSAVGVVTLCWCHHALLVSSVAFGVVTRHSSCTVAVAAHLSKRGKKSHLVPSTQPGHVSFQLCINKWVMSHY